MRAQYLLALAEAHRAAGELDRLLGTEGLSDDLATPAPMAAIPAATPHSAVTR